MGPARCTPRVTPAVSPQRADLTPHAMTPLASRRPCISFSRPLRYYAFHVVYYQNRNTPPPIVDVLISPFQVSQLRRDVWLVGKRKRTSVYTLVGWWPRTTREREIENTPRRSSASDQSSLERFSSTVVPEFDSLPQRTVWLLLFSSFVVLVISMSGAIHVVAMLRDAADAKSRDVTSQRDTSARDATLNKTTLWGETSTQDAGNATLREASPSDVTRNATLKKVPLRDAVPVPASASARRSRFSTCLLRELWHATAVSFLQGKLWD